MRRPLLLFSASVAILAAVVLANAIRQNPVRELLSNGDAEIPTDSAYVRWYAHAAHCLGISAPYDRRLRYFVGHRVPASWEQRRITDIAGYTNRGLHMILIAPRFVQDSAVVVHEQVHNAMTRDGHPPQYFAVAVATRCGLTPGVDR